MPRPHLLVHLPEKGKRLESLPTLIEAYCFLAKEQGYVWLCKPGPPLDLSVRQNLAHAIQQGEEVWVYLFVRLSLNYRQIALYHARLLDVQGPGPNTDREHILMELRGRSCGTWLKLTGLEPIAAEQIDRLYDIRTGQPVPIWTDLRTDLYVVVEGEYQAAQPEEPGYGCWLLCLNQARTKAEFDRTWRFRPIVAFQPGSAEFITEYEGARSQRILVYDRVFGSPTYLTILGLYEVSELISQGTTAGTVLYTAQLREVAVLPTPLRLDSRQTEGLWSKLDLANRPTDWDALIAGNRALLPLSEKDYGRILSEVGQGPGPETPVRPALGTTRQVEETRQLPTVTGPKASNLTHALAALETITAKHAYAVTEVECYHVLHSLERALREFIDQELSRVSRDWWAEGRLPSENRIRAEERKQKREHPFPWLSQQDLPTKEYLDFSDYAEIITLERNWKDVFQPIFIHPEVIRGKLIELNVLRNDIAHMREIQPLDKETFLAISRQLLLTIRSRLSSVR